MELIAYTPPPMVLRGIDCAGWDPAPRSPVIDAQRARDLYALGYRWVARYTRPDGVVLDNPKPGGDWQGCYSTSIAESRWILGANLLLLQVQFGIWRDTNSMHDAGKAAASCTRLIGAPAEVHHSMDVEGRGPKASGAPKCKARIEAWAAGNNSSGGRTVMYSDNTPLSGFGAYRLRGVDRYWQAGAPLQGAPMPRGFGIEQDPPRGDKPDDQLWFGDKMVCDVLVDTDTMRPDRFGDMPTLIGTPEAAAALEAEYVMSAVERPFAAT
jgi:hypothetical protein